MGCSCFGAKKAPDGARLDTKEDSLRNIKQISYNELRSATDDFHSSNKIGRGGFGTVYKGTLKGGRQVAVKTLSAQSKQGVREFLNEINTISLVKHQHLVELIGCCIQGANQILVYEYIENNSLDRALLGSRSTNILLDWGKRSAICLGVGRGLTYLHEEIVPHIVHRDIKASNILLDKELNPKIGDFGLAKLFPDDITHISTRIAGTTGYLAPEYALGGQLTMKADVYSFGILILKIISGRSSSRSNWGGTEKLLLEWKVSPLPIRAIKTLLELVDPDLGEYPEEEVIKHIKVALFCTQASANRRSLMSQVVEMLTKNIRLNEKLLSAPGFFQDSSGKNETPSSLKKSSDDSTTTNINSSVPVTITEITLDELNW